MSRRFITITMMPSKMNHVTMSPCHHDHDHDHHVTMSRLCASLRRRLDSARKESMMLRASALIPLTRGISIKSKMMR